MDITRTEDYDPADFEDCSIYSGDVIVTMTAGELETVKKALQFYCEKNQINEVQTAGLLNKTIGDFLENDPVKHIVEAANKAICKYDPDNIDVVKNEETDEMEVIYHSDNNSFTVEETGIDYYDLSDLQLDDLESELDSISVGHSW